MLRSLERFNEAVADRPGAAALRTAGAALARATLREAVRHTMKHVVAAERDKPNSRRVLVYAAVLRRFTERARQEHG